MTTDSFPNENALINLTDDEADHNVDLPTDAEPAEDVGNPKRDQQPRRGCLRISMLLFAFLIVTGIIAIVFKSRPLQTEEEKRQVLKVEEAVKKAGQQTTVVPKTEDNLTEKLSRAEQYPGAICNLLEEEPPESTEHPLDTPLQVAIRGLRNIRVNVTDYTATLVKQERVKGKLQPQEIMHAKIRTEKKENGKITSPLHVYLKFLAPESVAGREVIWIRGRNNNKSIVHEAGILGMIKVNLAPDSMLAMKGNRYPISEIGIETLALRMLQKGERDCEHGECIVRFDRNVMIDDRPCTKVRIEHPFERDHFEYHIAEIIIDDQYNIPVHYAAYIWPEEEGGEPVLLEKYTYLDFELNPGLPDSAFDPDNEEYDFP